MSDDVAIFLPLEDVDCSFTSHEVLEMETMFQSVGYACYERVLDGMRRMNATLLDPGKPVDRDEANLASGSTKTTLDLKELRGTIGEAVKDLRAQEAEENKG